MVLGSIITRILENQYTWNLALLGLVGAMILYIGTCIRKESNPKLFWYFILAYLFLARSYDFNQLWTLNQDEEQWIFCARSMAHEPITWFKYFMAFDYTRFFTILPLALIVFLTKSAGYIQARFIQIFLTFIFLRLGYSATSKLFGRKVSLAITAMFSTFVGMSRNADIIAYNSEIFVSILYLLFVIQVIRFLNEEGLKYSLFLSGIFLGLMPFAKEQSVLIAFISGISLVLILILRKEYQNAFKLCLGGLSGFFIILIPVLAQNGLELIGGLFNIAVQYSDQGLQLRAIGENPYSMSVFLQSYFINKEYLPFVIAMLLAIPAIINRFRIQTTKPDLLLWVILSGFIMSLYSIYKPGNNFFHYSILNWPFLFLFVGYAISGTIFLQNKFWIASLLVVICQVHDLRFRQVYPIHNLLVKNPNSYDSVQQIIEQTSNKSDKIVIWGWNNKYYVAPERERGSAFLYPKFAFGNFNNKALVINQYIQDFGKFKPKIIIEAIGNDQFDFKDYKTQSISSVSKELGHILNKEYNLIYRENSYFIYLRK